MDENGMSMEVEKEPINSAVIEGKGEIFIWNEFTVFRYVKMLFHY